LTAFSDMIRFSPTFATLLESHGTVSESRTWGTRFSRGSGGGVMMERSATKNQSRADAPVPRDLGTECGARAMRHSSVHHRPAARHAERKRDRNRVGRAAFGFHCYSPPELLAGSDDLGGEAGWLGYTRPGRRLSSPTRDGLACRAQRQVGSGLRGRVRNSLRTLTPRFVNHPCWSASAPVRVVPEAAETRPLPSSGKAGFRV
jgi:hypothetical protein